MEQQLKLLIIQRELKNKIRTILYKLSIILGICEECIIIKSNLNKTNKSIEDIEKLIQDKNDIIQAITLNNREIRDIDNNIYNIKNSLNSFRNEKENINYNLNMISQYNTEYNEYKSKFEKIKVLKYHSTPTTGIQLMFIDMYISKILGAANELICRLFNNQFTLLPFIITETEFAIPVAVNGGINHDDISSMSGAQIAIISMVISVAILSQTSTKLNILIPDEVDATFDEVNRREYLNMINTLIAMIGSNQCILVSHNSEYNITDDSTIYLQEYCSNY
jgi:DNA repair exonuclease SbcCD ATPase subunit